MNEDLISREELLFAIRQQLAFQKEKAELTTIDADKMAHSLIATGIQLAIDIIDNAPTYEERNKGVWKHIIEEDNDVECPFCGYQDDGVYSNFCPKCGAQMEVGEEQ